MKKKNIAILCIFPLLCTSCKPKVEEKDGKYYKDKTTGEVIVQEDNLDCVATTDNNRVFYEIFVGSFSDSNGDGIGDLRGIINRFDYLNDGNPNSGKSLGIEGIWLTPIFYSPSYHKYDIQDYYRIDPEFGTENDLKDLIKLCKERNVKLILDLPINHTSTNSQWFKKFVTAHQEHNTSSAYYNYYSFYSNGETAPSGREFKEIPNVTPKQYYECNFSGDMPELDFDNYSVRQATLDIGKYYLNLGVDGFRFDAAKYVYYGDNTKSTEFWEWYINELKKVKSDIYTVSEVWSADSEALIYEKAGNTFNFTMSGAEGRIADTAKKGNVNNYVSYVSNYLTSMKNSNSNTNFCPFISNHDMDRAAGYLSTTTHYAQMAANLYLLGPGSPFIYYGEEIGMKGSRGSAQTDADRRLAMLWGDDDNIKNPIGSSYTSTSQTTKTVKEQLCDEESLLTYYKRLLRIRNSNPEIARGTYRKLSFSDKAGGFLATYQGSTVGVFHNTTDRTITLDLSTLSASLTSIRSIAGKGNATLEGVGLTIEGQTSVVLK